jgi:mono/diheme cytochrome c family protein
MATPKSLRMRELVHQRGFASAYWSKTMTKSVARVAIVAVAAARAQSADPSLGRHLAETVCSACHQTDPDSLAPSPNPKAPSFLDISRTPSLSDLAIKVFLRSSHPSMPNFILSPEEIDSVTAYIRSLNRK